MPTNSTRRTRAGRPAAVPATETRVVSMRCLLTVRGGHCDWHDHPFDELCLTTDDATTNGHTGTLIKTQPDTLMLFCSGERHGFWSAARQAPRFWVLHFTAGPEVYQNADRLTERKPARRIWKLTPGQAANFKWLFVKIFHEHTQPRAQSNIAEAAWLRLLLVSIQRWASRAPTDSLTPEVANPDLLQLWHLVNECARQPSEFTRRFLKLPNYDSLRHNFKKTFGISPGRMVLRLRMELAKNLLLETPFSVKEIAAQLGYVRQHEFARAFHQQVGRAPTDWRAHPFPAHASFSSKSAQ